MISAICALTQVLAVSAYAFVAFVLPITIPVGRAVFQYLIIWAYIAVVVFVVSILMFPEEAFLGHRTCVWEQWPNAIIYEQLGNRWCFVTGICDQGFYPDVLYLVVLSLECTAVMHGPRAHRISQHPSVLIAGRFH